MCKEYLRSSQEASVADPDRVREERLIGGEVRKVSGAQIKVFQAVNGLRSPRE
jgi:hypothetical protein